MNEYSTSHDAESSATRVNAEIIMDAGDKPRSRMSTCCDQESCGDPLSKIADNVHVKLLRIFGALTVIFSIIEAIIGILIYKFTVNYTLGAWWISILAFLAGVCAIGTKSRGWVTGACVLATASVAVTLIGSIMDSIAASILIDLSACVSKDSNNLKQNYGNSRDYSRADDCILLDGTSHVVDGCYCVTDRGNYCGQFTISSFSRNYGMGCKNVIDTFPKMLVSSAAATVLTLACVIAVAVVSCVVLCCPTRSSLIQYPAKDPEVGEDDIVVYKNTYDKY